MKQNETLKLQQAERVAPEETPGRGLKQALAVIGDQATESPRRKLRGAD